MKKFVVVKSVNTPKSGHSKRPANNEPQPVNQPKTKLSKRKPVGKEATVWAWTRHFERIEGGDLTISCM